MTEVTKVRLRFAKCGDLRLVSHHDIMRCLERMLRRARIPIALTQGFNPRPKMIFALALGLGIEGRSEVVDLELFEPLEPVRAALTAKAGGSAGVRLDRCPPVACRARHRPVPGRSSTVFRFSISADRGTVPSCSRCWPARAGLSPGAGPIASRPSTCVPQLVAAELTADGLLRFRLKVSPDGSARPEELLEALALRDLLDQGAVLTRTDVELEW